VSVKQPLCGNKFQRWQGIISIMLATGGIVSGNHTRDSQCPPIETSVILKRLVIERHRALRSLANYRQK
jgi:hypothetical protein